VEFGILGPLEVREQGRSIELGARKQRAVLALLLLHRGEVVSADRMIDELWGERPPATAAKSLQVYVSQLRKALGDGLLETRDRGYRLRVDAAQVDIDRFERMFQQGRELFAAGDARAAAETLRGALGLWRGTPLAEFAYEGFAQTEIARLDELRLAALEERIDADLALGRHIEVIPELEALVREHPLHERLRAQLILALYRAGRQAEALEVYRETRATLVDELGLEPGRELQDLEQAILRQDPLLHAPARGVPLVRRRRTGGLLIALGGALLVAAAIVAAVIAMTRGGEARIVFVSPNSLAAIDPRTNEIVGQFSVGDGPTRIAVGRGKVWVMNRAQTISVVDVKDRTVVKTFAVGATPADIAFGAGNVWVGDSVTSSVLRIDPYSGVVAQTIPAPPLAPPKFRPGPRPDAGAIAFDGETVWFASGNTTLSRIDARSGRIVARLRYRGRPRYHATEIAVGEGAVWVLAAARDLTRIDPRTNETVAASTVTARGPIAAGLGSVWLVDTPSGTVWQVDPGPTFTSNLPIKSIRVGQNPVDVAVGGGAVWVASADGTVAKIDPTTARVVRTIRVGRSLGGIAVGEGAIWVAVD
jgi:DNA-binding SARP family transcriptional activator/streptogramin lyase